MAIIHRQNNFSSDCSDEDYSAFLTPSCHPRALVLSDSLPAPIPATAEDDLAASTWTGPLQTITRDSVLAPHSAGIRFHSKSLIHLPNASNLERSEYEHGLQAPCSLLDEVEDKLRFFLEECDHLDGFDVYAQVDCGLGGLAETLCTRIHDETSHKPVVLAAVQTPKMPTRSQALSLARLSSSCFFTLPLRASEPQVLAAALDVGLLPRRLKHPYSLSTLARNPVSLVSLWSPPDRSFCPLTEAPLEITSQVVVSASSLPVPTPATLFVRAPFSRPSTAVLQVDSSHQRIIRHALQALANPLPSVLLAPDELAEAIETLHGAVN